VAVHLGDDGSEDGRAQTDEHAGGHGGTIAAPIRGQTSRMLRFRTAGRCAIAIGVVIALAGACAASDGAPSLDGARAALTRYFDAMIAGDFDRAMDQRCETARVKEAERAAFLDQSARLKEAVGPLTITSVGPANPSSDLRSLSGADAMVIEYRIAVRGVASEELLGAVVTEDGTPRFCGFTTRQAEALHSLRDQVGDLGPMNHAPQELIPLTPGPDYRVVDDSDGTAPRPGVQSSWTRAWQFREYGGARVTAWRYDTVEQAAGRAAELVEQAASDGVEHFEVAGLAAAVGVRHLGYAWLWVQPPSEGPFIDQVVIRFGETVVSVSVANLPTGSTHDTALALVADVSRRAAG
jgi:hypothetical protein